MSAIGWSKNHLVQRLRDHEEELGYIGWDPSSGKWVLWLKDVFGVVNTAGAYIRAESYDSEEDARRNALGSPSAFILHSIWMRGLVKNEAEKLLDGSSQKSKDKVRSHFDRLPFEDLNKFLPTSEDEVKLEIALRSEIEIICKPWSLFSFKRKVRRVWKFSCAKKGGE